MCEGYYSNCEGEGETPRAPYWPKWKHYHSLFERFYSNFPELTFTETEPWTFYEFPELKLTVAGLNSTIIESHLDKTHYGHVGEAQLRWFAQKLVSYKQLGWMRLAVVHHNVMCTSVDDEENLRDAEDLKRILGPSINAILHGHTHISDIGWIANNLPILSTGSAALKSTELPEEVGNQYQIIQFSNTEVSRWTRRYDPLSKRWIGDTRSSQDGNTWNTTYKIALDSAKTAFNGSAIETKSAEDVPSPASVVQVYKPIEVNDALSTLTYIPRLLLRVESQHQSIRRRERERCLEILSDKQCVWVSADWGLGREGFLATVFDKLGGPEMLSNIFRLQTGNSTTWESLLGNIEMQLGRSLQEFLAALAPIQYAGLIFDDFPEALLEESQKDDLNAKINSLFAFCPNVKLIFSTRLPRHVEPEHLVELKPLEIHEVRSYLRNHNRAGADLDGAETLERIHTWSGGLPMHLDRLLDRLPFLLLSEILNEEVPISTAGSSEPIPDSLRSAVTQLFDASDKISRKSSTLLKVLTVLRDGETFYSIRRFYYRDPFYKENIDQLAELGLIENVPITQTAADLSIGGGKGKNLPLAFPKLLRIPRQVRDYVNTIVSDEERSNIIRMSMGLFFGNDWWRGKVRLRTSITNAYGLSALVGPGNEYVVIRHSLSRALEKRNALQIKRYATLAVSYCHRLLSTDRFRDAVLACEAIVALLRESSLTSELCDTLHMYAKALRMTGYHSEALTAVKEALSVPGATAIIDRKTEMLMTCALAHKSLGEKTEALECANEVIAISEKTNDEAYQAQGILAELTLSGQEQIERLKEIEAEARNHRQEMAANNISLELARQIKDPDEALRCLQRVILSAKDTYNRTRAIVEKASILTANRRAYEIDREDYRLLGSAYSYSYAQRIGTLLDRCHRVLWSMLKQDGYWPPLLRLFRFSSFIWSLLGRYEEETPYLRELDVVDTKDLLSTEGNGLRIEIYYLECRRNDHS